MGNERSRFADSAPLGAVWHDSRFWDEVGDEVNVQTMRWHDFARFVSPAGPMQEPDAGFQHELREHLRQLVRRLYTS